MSHPEESALKYFLIVHPELGNKAMVSIFDTPVQRIVATRNAILGEGAPETDPCPELEVLEMEGKVYFEGDPPVEWIEGYVIDERKRIPV